jgi:acyl-CoA thioester hydrolase
MQRLSSRPDGLTEKKRLPPAGGVAEKKPRETREPPPCRRSFACFVPVTPRWNDIDVFGHVNNAEFYAFFDTAVLSFLHKAGAIDGARGPHAMLVAESGARFHREVLFDDRLLVGLAVARLGRSSVHYRLGVFRNDEDRAAVDGRMVHVFTDRQTRRPVPILATIRAEFEAIRAAAETERPAGQSEENA